MRQRHSHGFTLIELMIVISVIAIIASIAIPNLLSARTNANEKSVVAALRSIATAQQLARTNATVDLNNNGQGEAPTLSELAGTEVLRGSTEFLTPAFLSVSLGAVDSDGHVARHSYYFALHLPDSAGVGVVASTANHSVIEPSMAENYWTAIAWPRAANSGGNRTMFTNQSGDILATRDTVYSGKDNVPPAGCALLGVAPTEIHTSNIAANAVGADGNFWRIVP